MLVSLNILSFENMSEIVLLVGKCSSKNAKFGAKNLYFGQL